MSFKLVIECSKDIDKLHIDFSDGTSVVTHSKTSSPKKPRQKKEPQSGTQPVTQRPKQEQFLDTDEDFAPVSQDVIELPKIDDTERPVNVADELQHLDI